MFEVKVTIEVPGLPEALNALAAAIAGRSEAVCKQFGGDNYSTGSVGTLNTGAITSNFASGEKTTAEAASTQPASIIGTVAPTPTTAPSSPAVPVAAPAPVVPTSAPQYTLEMIATAGSALIDAGKMGQLIQLLGKFGVASLTELAPESYGAVANELRALGAAI